MLEFSRENALPSEIRSPANFLKSGGVSALFSGARCTWPTRLPSIAWHLYKQSARALNTLSYILAGPYNADAHYS